ncbi:16184_t:CDS:2, partial [Funneliformis geosporum]
MEASEPISRKIKPPPTAPSNPPKPLPAKAPNALTIPIQVNQQNCRYYHYRLKANDQIIIKDKWLQVSTKQIFLPLSSNLTPNIVYEDQNILLVIKEHNQEIYKKSDPHCLDNQVQYYLCQQNPEKYQQQVKNFFVPVALHRLDKLTQG